MDRAMSKKLSNFLSPELMRRSFHRNTEKYSNLIYFILFCHVCPVSVLQKRNPSKSKEHPGRKTNDTVQDPFGTFMRKVCTGLPFPMKSAASVVSSPLSFLMRTLTVFTARLVRPSISSTASFCPSKSMSDQDSVTLFPIPVTESAVRLKQSP